MGQGAELVEIPGPTPQWRADVARVMGQCADYYRAVHGKPSTEQDVDDFFHDGAPGLPPGSERRYAIRAGGAIVGLAHLALGWKRPGQSLIGLLLVAAESRGRGYARAAGEALEAVARATPHGTSLRIGIVETNAGAFGFWRRLGFTEIGERHRVEGFAGEVVILEKSLARGP